MSITEIHIERADLSSRLSELRNEDARFITMTVLDLGDGIEVVYHFEKGDEIINLRMMACKGEEIPSITGIYVGAFIAENEAQDLFKIKISDLNINFGGRMLKSEGSQYTLLKSTSGSCPLIKRSFGRCRERCPAMVNIPKYVRQIASGDVEGAYNTIMEEAPLPAILGRVCFAACELGCRQDRDDKAVRCRLLKRYAADTIYRLKRRSNRATPTGKRIAVIGGGPSGLTAAYYLGMLGHDVTIYEMKGLCGGAMLAYIPRFRLPRDILDMEVAARIEEARIRIEMSEVDSLEPLFKEGYEAIYVAIGAQLGLELTIPGEDSPGVLDAMELLSEVNVFDAKPDLGGIVLVLGGGDGAIDAARVAKRLGAESVTICYRRTREEMPASEEQVKAALEEGIDFMFLVSPVNIIQGTPLKVVFRRMRLTDERDAKGRRRSVELDGSDFTVDANTVVRAIGQRVDLPKGFNLEVDDRGFIVTKDDSGATSLKGVWAGGDVVVRPKSVIEGIRDGRRAASAIDKYLGGKGLPDPSLDMGELVSRPSDISEILDIRAVTPRVLAIRERAKGFEEVECGFDKEEAKREASRCWRCDWNE